MSEPSREIPGRLQAVLFHAKTRAFQLRRVVADSGRRPLRHCRGELLRDAPVVAEVRTLLWNKLSPEEFPLTAGKIHNLRLAARALDGIEIPAGEVFSFWRQLGRTTRRRGFTAGRELREGCLVPSVGGGLCQLTGPLYQVALIAGFTIVERHAHSRVIAGSSAEAGLDATVFWNYVDLRFRSDHLWRLEVTLDASDLIVRIRSLVPGETLPPRTPRPTNPPRPAAQGDCLTCGQTACFRHPAATSAHAPALGHSTYLLDAWWPEFDRWCVEHARPGDRWLTPLDGYRWKKPNYGWSLTSHHEVGHATLTTLLRAWTQRRLPAQGSLRQQALLRDDQRLAAALARRISPECRHLVVSQNLLPHLWRLGVLGGRTFDVLMLRWPLAELHRQLDEAAAAQPDSPTLPDFRAPADLVRDESAALDRAARLITPHTALAAWAGGRAWEIPWEIPNTSVVPAAPRSRGLKLFLPCSPLGRKGIHELAAALRGLDAELIVLGSAREGGRDPLAGLRWRSGTAADLADCHALLLPAWIEHQPRLALRALAMGLPVIATRGCGLPDHPQLIALSKPDPAAITQALAQLP